MKYYTSLCLLVLLILSFLSFNSCKKEIEPTPIASFTAPDSGYLDQPLLFTSTSLNAKSISWNFCDGSSSHENPVTHSYKSFSIYNVSLTASNSSENSLCTKDITILNGHAQYNLVNSSSISADLFAYYLDQDDLIRDLNYVGYVPTGYLTGYFLTNRSELHLGAHIESLYFWSVSAYNIEKFKKNQLILYDTTMMYITEKAKPLLHEMKKIMVKDILREANH